jgi:hypothetical protein
VGTLAKIYGPHGRYTDEHDKAPAPAKFVFHTYFNEQFQGDSENDIIQALYHNSKEGMNNISFEDWWDYQNNLWLSKYRTQLPPPNAPDASKKMLDLLVRTGALLQGPLTSQTMGAPTHG